MPDFLAAGPRDVLVPEGGARPRARCCCSPTWRRARVRGPVRADGRQALKLTAAIALGGGVATLAAWALVEFGG